LLTPGFAEKIRRPYRRRDLMQAVIVEMLALQHTMAVCAYEIRARNAVVSVAFLGKILPIVEGYKGPDRREEFVQGMKRIRSLSEAQRASMHLTQNAQNPNISLGLRQYAIPLLATQIADLAICSRDFQRSVLHIRHRLDLFNQLTLRVESLFDKTFNNPSPGDRAALIANQEEGYRDAGKQAEMLVQAISELKKSVVFGWYFWFGVDNQH
jgi:hypothetical protein